MKWLQIETAPKDGTPILAYTPGNKWVRAHATVIRWFENCSAWGEVEGENYFVGLQFTHWMPIPEPPL